MGGKGVLRFVMRPIIDNDSSAISSCVAWKASRVRDILATASARAAFAAL
jgi:hypothetical protein